MWDTISFLEGTKTHKLLVQVCNLNPQAEELFDESEKIVPTFHNKLRIAIPQNVPSMVELSQHTSALKHIVENNSVSDVITEIQKIVPNFKRENVK